MKRTSAIIMAIILILTIWLTGCGGDKVTHTSADEHTDNNGNGICDGCKVSVVNTIDFYAINDLHGKFTDSASQPGVDELTTYLLDRQSIDDHTVFLSSGDMWQGGAESNLTRGEIITEWMNELGFTAMTLGNHEFDWSDEYITSNGELADFPMLAINVYDKTTENIADYCAPSVLVERGDVVIGIIGAIGDCYSSISGDKVGDMYIKTGSELTQLVKTESAKLRTLGADIIVYSIHDGYGRSADTVKEVQGSDIASYYDISLSDGYVDLVFEAHTHQSYVLRDSYGVYHVQGGGDNDGITHVEVDVNYVTDTIEVSEAEVLPSFVYEACDSHEIVDDLLLKYDEQIDVGREVLGYNDRVRGSSALRSLVAKLYYECGVAEWGSQYDIVLGGGFISIRDPYELYVGDVLYSQLLMLFPFDNQIVLCSIKGSDLRSRFINTSNSNYYIYCKDGNVTPIIDPDETYYVVVDTYSSTYAPNKLTEIARKDETTFARDLLAQHIREGEFGTLTTEYTLTGIPDIIDIGEALSGGETTTEDYYVEGEIIEITNTIYGNMTIQDAQGNTLFVYGVSDITGGIGYSALTVKPQVGDTVVLVGPIQKYVSGSDITIELYHARLVKIE